MKRQTKPHRISVSLAVDVQLDAPELRFLRKMAQHCINTKMPGFSACKKLDGLLHAMGINEGLVAADSVYELFEE